MLRDINPVSRLGYPESMQEAKRAERARVRAQPPTRRAQPTSATSSKASEASSPASEPEEEELVEPYETY